MFGFIEEEEEEEDDNEEEESNGVSQSELADDLSRDHRHSLGDDYSLVGDPMLYGDYSLTSSYRSVSSSDTGTSQHTSHSSCNTVILLPPPPSSIVQATLRRGMEDPQMRDAMVKLIKQKQGLPAPPGGIVAGDC